MCSDHYCPGDEAVDQWLERQIETLRGLNAEQPARAVDHDVIDTYFRYVLQEVRVYGLDA